MERTKCDRCNGTGRKRSELVRLELKSPEDCDHCLGVGSMIVNQRSFWDKPFDGDDYNDRRDRPRLTGQIKRVYSVMKDGEWRSLDQIHSATGDPHASISAQLRHLRKEKFGNHVVKKKHLGNGLYVYRLLGRKK
jgi:hypothetical protein